METHEKLEKIKRFTPEVSGYRGAEKSRETDKTVRLHITSELNHLRREMAKKVRKSAEKNKDSNPLLFDRTLQKMEWLANTVKYASRSYRSFFEGGNPAPQTLDSLYSYDLSLFHRVRSLKKLSERLAGEDPLKGGFNQSLEEFEKIVDRINVTFLKRHDILANGKV